MSGIAVTGNEHVDVATSEIAVAIRGANPTWSEQQCYDEAMRLRNEIAEGTRELGNDCRELEGLIPKGDHVHVLTPGEKVVW